MEITDTRKARAMDLMVEGRKQVDIAKIVDVSTRTLRRWAADPEFAQELKEDRLAFVTISRTQTAAAALEKIEEDREATRFLARIRDAENLPLASRMRAAGMLMNQGLRVTAQLMREEQAEKRRAEKADKSGQRSPSISPNGPTSPTGPMFDIFDDDEEPGQKRTKADTPAEYAARQAKLAVCEQEMKKYEEIERTVKAMKNVNPDALEKFKDDLENARIAMENTMGAIDNAEPEALSTIQIKPEVVALPK